MNTTGREPCLGGQSQDMTPMLGGDRRIERPPIQIDPYCGVGWMSEPVGPSPETVAQLQEIAAAMGASIEQVAQALRAFLASVTPTVDAFVEALDLLGVEQYHRSQIAKLVPKPKDIERQHKAIVRMGMQRSAIQRMTYMPGRRWRG